MHSVNDFERLSREADAAGFRLEVVNGLGIGEPISFLRHQHATVRIARSITPIDCEAESSCAAIAVIDLSIRFPDGSNKRPDVSVLCREPDEQDTEATLLPEAVVEVLSADYEAKDLVIGVPFYRQVGVKDIVVLDPRTGEVRHWQQGQPERMFQSPVVVTFLCGCSATV